MNWNWLRFLQTLAAVAALFIATGLIALAAGALDYREARGMAAWPSTNGRVVASEVVTAQFRGRSLRYAPAARIAYSYSVDGEVYLGERVGVETLPVEAGSAAGQRLLRDYPVGAAVTVYYDPADPANAVLEREPPTGGLTAGLRLIGLGLIVAGIRWALRKRPYRSSDE